MLEHLELRACFSKSSKIAVHYKCSANLSGQRSFQMPDPTIPVLRLHVAPCCSPNEFRLSRRKLDNVFLRPWNVCSTHNSPVPTNLAAPSAAALEAGLMEQEQHYPCSAVLP